MNKKIFYSIITIILIFPGPSEPRDLNALCKARSCSLNWKVPAEMNGKITDFEIQYRRQQLDILPNFHSGWLILSYKEKFLFWRAFTFFQTVYQTVKISHNGEYSIQTKIVDLLPYSAYKFRVRAATTFNDSKLWGDFNYIEEDTAEDGLYKITFYN